MSDPLKIPFFNSKSYAVSRSFDLNDPVERKLYFKEKLGDKIEQIKEFLDSRTFVGYLMAKKQAGKGTYAKMFEEIVGSDRFQHVSIGDLVRKAGEDIGYPDKKREIENYLENNYRGFLSVTAALASLQNREQGALLPTDLILALVKMEIDRIGNKALFIDGLPRNLDQISYSLYFRDLINHREDPDFFVLIDVPETLIDLRMTGRKVCPLCKTSKNLTLNPSKFVVPDDSDNGYSLLCDNERCVGYGKEKLVSKEGDSEGKESIRERLDTEGELMSTANSLQGIPKVLIRNTIPVTQSSVYVENFEISPSFSYTNVRGEIEIARKPLVLIDDDGIESYSLSGACVVVSMVDQIYKILIG